MSTENAENLADRTDGCTTGLKPVRMPWIHLIDPVTGELPKNYLKILEAEKAAKDPNSVKKVRPQRIKLSELIDPEPVLYLEPEKKSSKFSNNNSKLVPRRETGNLSKAKKSSVIERSTQARPSTSNVGNGGQKQQFSKSTVSTATGRQTMFTKAADTGIRKKLFQSPKSRKTKISAVNQPNRVVKNPTCQIRVFSPSADNTIALLEMSPAETELLHDRPNLTSESLEQFTLDERSTSPKNECSSGSSINEFLQFEQLCRTPKQKKSSEETCLCDQSDHYITKFTMIVDKLSADLEEAREILQHLKNCKKINNKGENKKRCSSVGKENFPSNSKPKVTSILTSTKKKRVDLRVDTLKKNVTFNELKKNDKVAKVSDLYNLVRATNPILRTPKVLSNCNSDSPSYPMYNLSNRVQDQCLLLQETPK